MPEYITKERAMDCVYEAVKATDANAQDLYAIRRKIAKEPGIGWISVKDRLPKLGQEVLVYAVGKIDGFIGDSTYAICKRFIQHILPSSPGHEVWNTPWQYFHTDYEITHWMPLSLEPPKEVNGDA